MSRTTDSPTIRAATRADAAAVSAIYAPVVRETAITFEVDPPDGTEMRRRIEATGERLPFLVCDRRDEVAGYAYASPHGERPGYRWSADVSVYVGADHRRARVASGLYESLLSLLRLQGIVTARAVIALPNAPSVGLHESFGFEKVGHYPAAGFKHGEWHDVGHWWLVLGEPPAEPEEPDPVDAVLDTDEGRTALDAGAQEVEP